jgi:hypothetical protein
MITVAMQSDSARSRVARPLEWDDFPHARQALSVRVSAMNLAVAPTLAGQRWGQWSLQFEGRTDGQPQKGLSVAGSIELLDRGERLGLLFEQWKRPPKEFEGCGFLVQEHESTVAAFRFTLYCKPEALCWIYRAFTATISSPQHRLGMEITISFPDYVEPDFWRRQWRNEIWNVASWKVIARREGA